MTNQFEVAGHRFSVNADAGMFSLMRQYQPFWMPDEGINKLVFSAHVVEKSDFPSVKCSHVLTTVVDGDLCLKVSKLKDGLYGEQHLQDKLSMRMIVDADYAKAIIALDNDPLWGINNALMLLFALSTSKLQTVLFHAAAICLDGAGYLFLGKSGTGKSTHARLWINHIPHTELLNDDNPVVRIHNQGEIRVYGSPWSGKTPCYRQKSAPLKGIVKLGQADHNVMNRLSIIEAYSVIAPSVSGMRWDDKISDCLHETESKLALMIPVWHLDCLPDKEAARLCAVNLLDLI